MKNVFMAVAMDLGDPTSPYGSVHPRDKQDVGARLVLASRAVAYGDSSVYYTGPIAKTTTVRWVLLLLLLGLRKGIVALCFKQS